MNILLKVMSDEQLREVVDLTDDLPEDGCHPDDLATREACVAELRRRRDATPKTVLAAFRAHWPSLAFDWELSQHMHACELSSYKGGICKNIIDKGYAFTLAVDTQSAWDAIGLIVVSQCRFIFDMPH